MPLWRCRKHGAEADEPGPAADSGTEDWSSEDTHLRYLRVSYEEVLAATKHEDDKIGRFLTAIAFIVAGALIFANSSAAGVRYILAGEAIPLTAGLLAGFSVAITLSVLFYILTIAGPLTIAPGAKFSYIYFEPIAGQTPESWMAAWQLESDELQEQLRHQYRKEVLNLAYRASGKRSRSRDASACFVAALLFFVLAVLLSLHSLSHEDFINATVRTAASPSLPVRLAWTPPLHWVVSTVLVAFHSALLYERLRAHQTRRPLEKSRSRGYVMAILGGDLAICGALYPYIATSTLRWLGPVAIILAALWSSVGYWRAMPVLGPNEDGELAVIARGTRLGLAIMAAVLPLVALLPALDVTPWAVSSLVVALVVTLSPLGLTVADSVNERRKRAAAHRKPACVTPAA